MMKKTTIKKLVVSSVVGGLLLACLCGCDAVEHNYLNPDTNQLTGSEKRFSLIANWTNTSIVYDKETGVEYVRSRVYDDGWVYTVLLNADGTPVVYEGTE